MTRSIGNGSSSLGIVMITAMEFNINNTGLQSDAKMQAAEKKTMSSNFQVQVSRTSNFYK